MSTAARIDELRKKFEENPRRYFAPLANELRKAGDLVQAIALCREHLPKQPGHMSGYIVFGQALYESGALDEARSVFEQALSLDPENLIALRHLGDLAKAAGDTAVARRWYERALDADPRNDDIASQLASLASPPVPASARPTPAMSAAILTPPIPMPAIGLGAMPTPDAALRAVDFDVVNARIAHYTPLDLDAIESAGASSETTMGASQSFAAPRFGTPVNLPAVSDDGWEELAQPPAPRPPTPLDSPAMGGTPASGAAAFATPGFGAPSWQTPHAATPTVPTPAFGAAPAGAADVHDALSAFAEHDPADQLPGDDFVFPATSSRTPAMDTPAAADAAFEVADAHDASAPFSEAFEEGIIAPEWPDTADLLARVSAPRSITPVVVDITPDAVDAFGREPHDPEPLADDFAVLGHSDVAAEIPELVELRLEQAIAAAPTPVDSIAIDADAEVDPVQPIDAVTASEAPAFGHAPDAPRDDAADEAAITGETEPDDSPWLAATEPVDNDEESQRELEEIADAFASDARSVGDDGDLLVTSVQSNEGDGAEESFADLLDVPEPDDEGDVDESEAEAIAAAAPSNDSPAFVTETMAELLISQGFIGRAANVYEELTRRHPYDPVLSSRLAELRDQLADGSDSSAVPDAPMAANFVAVPTPLEGTSAFQTPSLGTPSFDPPASDPPPFGTPAFSATVAPGPASPTPAYPTPAYATPAHSSSAYDTPSQSSPLVTPWYATPAFAAVSGGASLVTARERFAQLAARRVPRRTPPQPSAVVAEHFEGLSSLFGEHDAAGAGDDAAARALADAFAPISEADAASGAMLDFGENNSDTGDLQPPVPVSQSERPATNAGVTNAGFSFDRFFPDPATQAAPPADPAAPPVAAPPVAAPPVGDDLAQFSAWLKGLGTT